VVFGVGVNSFKICQNLRISERFSAAERQFVGKIFQTKCSNLDEVVGFFKSIPEVKKFSKSVQYSLIYGRLKIGNFKGQLIVGRGYVYVGRKNSGPAIFTSDVKIV